MNVIEKSGLWLFLVVCIGMAINGVGENIIIQSINGLLASVGSVAFLFGGIINK